MSAARASAAVIRNAIKAAKDCGIPIGAVEVLRDGSVRILATTPEALLPSGDQEVNSCDGLFGEASG